LTAYGSECCDTAWDEFGIDCMTLEANYNWDCSGCNCPGDGEAVCGDGFCSGDESYDTVQMIVCLQVNVQMDRILIVTEQMNAGQSPGLVMASQIVKISSMVLT